MPIPTTVGKPRDHRPQAGQPYGQLTLLLLDEGRVWTRDDGRDPARQGLQLLGAQPLLGEGSLDAAPEAISAQRVANLPLADRAEIADHVLPRLSIDAPALHQDRVQDLLARR